MGVDYTILVKKPVFKKFVETGLDRDMFQSDVYFLFSRTHRWYVITGLLGVDDDNTVLDGRSVDQKLDTIAYSKNISEVDSYWVIAPLKSILWLFGSENVLIVSDAVDSKRWKKLTRQYYDLSSLYFWDFNSFNRSNSPEHKHIIEWNKVLKEFLKYDGDPVLLIKGKAGKK